MLQDNTASLSRVQVVMDGRIWHWVAITGLRRVVLVPISSQMDWPTRDGDVGSIDWLTCPVPVLPWQYRNALKDTPSGHVVDVC